MLGEQRLFYFYARNCQLTGAHATPLGEAWARFLQFAEIRVCIFSFHYKLVRAEAKQQNSQLLVYHDIKEKRISNGLI